MVIGFEEFLFRRMGGCQVCHADFMQLGGEVFASTAVLKDQSAVLMGFEEKLLGLIV
jgi:hypothetical protein